MRVPFKIIPYFSSSLLQRKKKKKKKEKKERLEDGLRFETLGTCNMCFITREDYKIKNAASHVSIEI